MKTNIFEKIARSIHTKKISKPLAICISTLFIISMISILATSQAQTNPLTGQYWITPVPADKSTGRVTQTVTTDAVTGSIPGDCYGAYPTIADNKGNWDLTATPILSFDISINEFWQGDLQDHTGLSIIIVDATNNGWNPSDESACDLSTTYGHAATTGDGSIMRVADSAAPTHYTIDLRTLGVPLNHISQLIWSIRPGMKGITVNYQITNIQVSDSATTAPAPTASPTPTQTPKPTASPTISPPKATPTPKPIASPTPQPTAGPTPLSTSTPTALFNDGFETGSFSAWTGTKSYNSGVSTSIQTTTKYSGTYASKVAIADGAQESGICQYINLGTSYSTIDARVYMQLSAKPKTGSTIELMGFSNDGYLPNTVGTRVDIVNTNGTPQWRLNYYNNGWQSIVVGSVNANTWYSVEVKLVMGSGTGETHLYVNGVALADKTGLTNTALGSSVKYFSLGACDELGSNTFNAYFDSVAVAKGYIGP